MSLYAAAHANPQRAGDARLTALHIIRDEFLEGKLIYKVMVIAGTTSGIGVEATGALSATRATLVLTARDIKKAEAVLVRIPEFGRVR
jgi:hypothetical protein